MHRIARRAVLTGTLGLAAPAWAGTRGEQLAAAARRQVGVTRDYDPAYRAIPYPNGDVPRSTGVCADVVIRAARDGLGLDLQQLVHEDMRRAFPAYPSRRTWGLTAPDPNIDHRRVLNLETYWKRQGARVWAAPGERAGDAYPGPLAPGDFLTWLVGWSAPHVGVVVRGGREPQVVHNIGGGAQLIPLSDMRIHQAIAHYRWPQG
jgi:uncharacterized protein YijF (DUF1287 family)